MSLRFPSWRRMADRLAARAQLLVTDLLFAAVQAMARVPGRSGGLPLGVPWVQLLIATFVV